MSETRSSAKVGIKKLVRYLEQNIHQLKAQSFNEAQARQSLIDPFFEALGWDVRNKNLEPPFRAEVLPEGRVRSAVRRDVHLNVSTEEHGEMASMLEYIADDEYKAEQKMATKKPDYRFRIQGSTKFFVEAKKPFVDLMTNHDAIFQIKRYGFSARVPISILTDFEQFRVFDCTRRPFYDKPKVGVLKEFDLCYKTYLDEFDKLYDTFSRDAVVGGSIELVQKKYLEKKKGEFALDRSFLDDLSDWRVELAQDIAKHPKNRRILTSSTLNECVQRILDRIVFLRVCEDRNIEVERTLLELMRVWQDHPGLSLYDKFVELIKLRRSLYNGLLFAEHESEELEVGNHILEKIFKNINYPLSPYNFDEIGVEILGSIYERFLGKTIRLTQKQVRIEEKPEVRKAGGVYYTPQYIVNYIVENTVGKLLCDLTPDPSHKNRRGASEGRGEVAKMKLTPKQVAKLKIIDIACGSGSFLLGAFQKLIDYHEQWYTQHPEDNKEAHGVRDAYENAQGRLVLSARKKREILVNNIYGVDIDPQAVEVTQMSLYLKVLEDENDATLNKPTVLALHDVLLPPLKNNIKCGNSLIGTDIGAQGDLFAGKPVGAIHESPLQRINPFDWATEFPQVFAPSRANAPSPHVGGEGRLARRNESEVGGGVAMDEPEGGFDCVIGNPPYGALFDELSTQYYERASSIFEDVKDVYALFMERGLKILKHGGRISFIVPSAWLGGPDYKVLRELLLAEQMERVLLLPFDVFADAYVDTTIFVVSKDRPAGNHIVKTYIYPKKEKISQIDLKEAAYDNILQKNWLQSIGKKLILNSGTMQLLEKIQQKKPLCFSDITEIKRGVLFDQRLLTKKKSSDSSHRYFEGDVFRYHLNSVLKNWIEFSDKMRERPKDLKWFQGERILLRRLVNRQQRLMATSSADTFITNKNLYSVLPKRAFPKLNAVLAVLNSRLVSYLYVNQVTQAVKDDFPQVTINDISTLPIPDFSKQAQLHDTLVALVEKMLDLHKQLNKASFDSEKEPIQRQIEATDRKIDELVYELYGIMDEERKIIEGSAV